MQVAARDLVELQPIADPHIQVTLVAVEALQFQGVPIGHFLVKGARAQEPPRRPRADPGPQPPIRKRAIAGQTDLTHAHARPFINPVHHAPLVEHGPLIQLDLHVVVAGFLVLADNLLTPTSNVVRVQGVPRRRRQREQRAVGEALVPLQLDRQNLRFLLNREDHDGLVLLHRRRGENV